MENPSYVALSGQVARERQMDVLSNNIANVSTTAFKAQSMIFSEFLATSADGSKLSYVQDAGTVRDYSQGPLTQTGGQLDVALQGAGFLEVQTAQGIRYTRDGRMKLDSTGALVTLDGDPVLGQGDQPITVPANSASISIGQDGSISTLDGSVGRFAVVNFDRVQALSAEASGLYSTDQIPTAATDTKVVQGMVEESNVKPIIEITRLMNASHQFGAAKSFTDGESDRHKNAIDRLAKVV
jgi:flagellar basal-body rod protein FlgF